MEQVSFVDYEPKLQRYFQEINEEWLRKYFYVEPIDTQVLSKPDEYIIKPGGAIIFAKLGDQIIGTVALKWVSSGVFEMTKMGVIPAFQGRKIGELLACKIIDKAAEMGAKKVILYSSTKLAPAIQLYRKLGFMEIFCEPGKYERSDIKMEIDMTTTLSTQERTDLIESYGTAYDRIMAALAGIPKEMWLWRPAPGKWSIHENILHLADSEANSFIRCRRFAAEPGLSVMAYDQDAWAIKCNYHEQSTDDALELFRLLRKMSYELIKKLPAETWNNTVEHPENGTMVFLDWLRIYNNHTHIGQMQRTYTAWQQAQ